MSKNKSIPLDKETFEIPPRNYGRSKAINNDEELIIEALKGISKNIYKSSRDAARQLEPLSLTSTRDGFKKVGSPESIINRLSRAINKRRK